MYYPGPDIQYSGTKSQVIIDGKTYEAFSPEDHSTLVSIVCSDDACQDDYGRWCHNYKVWILRKGKDKWEYRHEYLQNSIQPYLNSELYKFEDEMTRDRFYTIGYIEYLKQEVQKITQTLEHNMQYKEKMQKVWEAADILRKAKEEVYA